MSIKSERRETIESGSPLSHHSLNQTKMYHSIQMEKKGFGNDRNAENSRRRKREQAGLPESEAVLVFQPDTNGLL